MSDLTGQTLGKYQLVDRLGRGGMADVYKGYQPGLDRYVAVKVMHPHLSEDPNFITRFRREAKSVAELHHANIVQVFDFDVQGENYYMVMEYIEGGQTLKQRLQDQASHGTRLPIEQTLDIVAKLADALAYAHNLGMIHRDIKPANVLVATLDRPVLSDFGIARLLNETGLTSSGALIGTPAYMSPEQGRGERIDGRSDIYSLGIVLYEMLTGQPPYDADTPYAIILKHINDPLTPPHLLIDPMPEVVERIVLKCLAKNPDDRFASMAELRDALRGARSAIGVQQATSTLAAAAPTLSPPKPQPSPTPPPEKIAPAVAPSRSARSVPRPVWLIGALLLVLVVGAIVVFALRGNPAPAATSTPATRVSSSASPEATSAAASASPGAVSLDAGYNKLLEGDTDAAYAVFQQALTDNPNDAHALVGRAVTELVRNGDAKSAAADLDRANQTIPDDPILHFGFGLLHSHANDYVDAGTAEQDFTRAIEACGDFTALCAKSYLERAQVRGWHLDNPQGAVEDVGHALELITDPNAKGDTYALRAEFEYGSLGNLQPALDDLQSAYQVNPWPGYLEHAAQYAVRAAEYGKAIEVYDQLLKEQNGDPRLLAGRAYVEWKSGDAEKARQSIERALQLDSTLREAHYLKGLLLLDADQPKDALAELQAAIANATSSDLDSMSSPFLNLDFGHEIYYDLARAAVATGDLTAAQDYLTQSLQKSERAEPYILRAEILKQQGDLAGARESYLKALDYTSDNPDLKASVEKALADLTK